MRHALFLIVILIGGTSLFPQSEPPTEHVSYAADVLYAFTNATIHIDARDMITKATLVVRNGVVIEVDKRVNVPSDAVVRDMKGAHIWPALVEPYSDRGVSSSTKQEREKERVGAAHWNGALRADLRVEEIVGADAKRDDELRKAGFATAFVHRMDGIARGSSAAILLNNDPIQRSVVEVDMAAHFSLKRGSSVDKVPGSQMGAIALLRQAFMDAQWHADQPSPEQHDPVLIALARQMKSPVVFEADDRNELLRCAKIIKEFQLNGIIKGGGDEYARLTEIKALNLPLLLPINFPDTDDVEDPYDALEVPLERMKQWALAPCNAAILDSANVPFAFTTYGRKDLKDLWKDMRRMVACGADSARVIEAFTTDPARLFGMQDKVGALREGMFANFLVTTHHLLNEKNVIQETWVRGDKFRTAAPVLDNVTGIYNLNLTTENWTLDVKEERQKLIVKARKVGGTDTAQVTCGSYRDGDRITLSFAPKGMQDDHIRLSGIMHADGSIWDGQGQRLGGDWFKWSAIRKANSEQANSSKKDSVEKVVATHALVTFPLGGFGWDTPPQKQTTIIRHATVWTNTTAGNLSDVDVCFHLGKILAVGPSLDADILFPGTKKPLITEIDGTGMHLTSGIIDEHSHIAISRGVNEGSSSISSDVRIGDVIDPDNINIYRDLAGGVTTAQLLHGSANPIGGQSALVKMRWGMPADSMLIKGAPKHIKFALGENVKQSNWNVTPKRFPQTRMGVEQFFYEQFYRAKDYDSEWRRWNEMKLKDREGVTPPRRDLKLEAVAEILNGQRNITCHSYVQSEIDMLMHVADSLKFKVNTFTHILEGYKMTAKMKEHGVNASTFSDWWAYKFEVYDAIPYNAALLHFAGVNTGINSDDAEMGRRLNQEAAKIVKYGGVSEIEAWKMVTINPAKMLKIDDRTGSVEVGKDADLVLWSANPLSILARAERTFVDGACYFDRAVDSELRKQNAIERDRLVRAMITAKRNGATVRKPKKEEHHLWHCDDLGDGQIDDNAAH